MDEMTLELNSPITEEQWDAITDVDFEHTDRVWFHTKNGKDVEFVKRKTGKWVFEDGSPVNRGLKMMETAVCSQCGETAPGYPFWECDLELTNFCPNCGAEMTERREDV